MEKKKIPIFLIDHELNIAKFSRYKKKFLKSPNPSNEDEYLEFLISIAKQNNLQGWVLFPNSDQIVKVVSKNKNILEEYYRVSVPEWDIIQNVYIKKNTYKIASEQQIPIPFTIYSKSLKELLDQTIPYPVVIKPSIRDNFYNHIKTKAYLVCNEKELNNIYKMVSNIIRPSEILVQEFIPGRSNNLYSYCPFFKNGMSIASITGQRLRQHPMDFGHATTYAALVDIPQLAEYAEKFLSHIGYYGVAEVEFMKDPRNGEYKLIEVNPRVWGWHALAIYSGADLPFFVYQDMVGETVNVSYIPKDITWVRYLTDIPTVFVEIINKRMKMSEYLQSMTTKKRDAVLSLKDPLPFIIELMISPYLWKKRGF